MTTKPGDPITADMLNSRSKGFGFMLAVAFLTIGIVIGLSFPIKDSNEDDSSKVLLGQFLEEAEQYGYAEYYMEDGRYKWKWNRHMEVEVRVKKLEDNLEEAFNRMAALEEIHNEHISSLVDEAHFLERYHPDASDAGAPALPNPYEDTHGAD